MTAPFHIDNAELGYGLVLAGLPIPRSPAPPCSVTTAKSPKAQAGSEHAGARGQPPRNVPYETATSAR